MKLAIQSRHALNMCIKEIYKKKKLSWMFHFLCTDFDITSHKYKYDDILEKFPYQHCMSKAKVADAYDWGFYQFSASDWLDLILSPFNKTLRCMGTM